MRNATLRFLALVVAVWLIGGAAPVQGQGSFAHGTVVALQGTPHLWFADEQGLLHWGGDTRALAGRHITWNNRVDVSLDRLRTLPRGDPWLSAGLLKDGDPIYLVKWETDWEQPQLFHIRSIGDVELFGINGSNYGSFVIERGAWEQRFGISAAGLQRHILAATTVPGTTRDNPAPIGAAVDMPNGWRISVTSVVPNATRRVVESQRYYSKSPKEGHQFFLVRLTIVRIGEGSANRAHGFEAVGGSNVSYREACGYSRIPDRLPPWTTEVFPGGSVSGNICFEVRSSEVGSLVMFYDPVYDRSERRYFSLTP